MMMQYKHISLADRVFEDLEKNILNGTYPRGSVLSESRLSEELGVSRTPIREALSRLYEDDLIEEGPNGAVVVGMTDEDMKDIYHIKLRIEPYIVSRAAEVITDDQIRELREILDQQEFYAQRDDHDKVRDFDTKFHDAIYRACGSRIYEKILTGVHHKLMRYRKASLSSHSSRITESVAEHNKIYAALAAHDPEGAKQAQIEHVQHAFASVLEAMGEDDAEEIAAD